MLKTAIKAAKKAGKIMQDNFGKVQKITYKENNQSILTEIDLKSEKAIIKTIEEDYPDHNILSEEAGLISKNSEYTWHIDPIDGTSNYAAGIPMYCVSIALVKNNEIILGVIFDPTRNELFYAEKGKGAFLNNKRIKVSNRNKLQEALVSFGLPSYSKASVPTLRKAAAIFPKIRGFRNNGSAAINLSYIACGRLDIYASWKINSWDYAAGLMIIKEAGGKVTDLKGNNLSVEKENIIATNKTLHDKFLKII